ncbi:MAG: FtsX-like permease family protein [Candidatus Hodarchaeota archaeon]
MYLFSRIASQAPEVLVTFLVFSLSTGVLGGVLFYLDSAGPDILEEMSSNVAVHMEVVCYSEFYDQGNITLSEIEGMIADSAFVSQWETLTMLQVYDKSQSVEERNRASIGVNNSFFDTFSDSIELKSGSQPLNDSSCYIDQETFIELELSFGNEYDFSVPTRNSAGDIVYQTESFTIAGVFESTLLMHKPSFDAELQSYLNMITTRDGLWNAFPSLDRDGDNSIQDHIWVRFDTDTLSRSNPGDAYATLRTIEKRLEQRALPFASVRDFDLLSVISEYSTWSTSMRVIALAFTVPSIIMGVMLIQYNSDLLADQRRRNIGSLKTRGASGRQAFRWIAGMVVFTGVIGSIGALLTGIVSALFSGTIRELMVFDLSQLSTFEIILFPQSIASLFVFSFIVGLIIGIPTAIRALLMEPSEAHQEVEKQALDSEEKVGNPIILTGIVGATGLLLFQLMLSLQGSNLEIFNSVMFSMTVIVLLSIFIAALTLLLSRPAASIKSRILDRFQRARLVVGSRIMARNAKVQNKSEAFAVMFIGLVFTAGIFSAVAATTGSNHMKELFKFQVGADVVVDVDPRHDNVTLDIVDQIRDLEGVRNAAGLLQEWGRVTFWMDYWSGQILTNRSIIFYGIDVDNWLDSAFLLPYFTFYYNPAKAFGEIKGNISNVISSFQPILTYDRTFLNLRVAVHTDEIQIELEGPEVKSYFNSTIVDVLANDPAGFNPLTYRSDTPDVQTYMPGKSNSHAFLIVDLDIMHEIMNTTRVSKIYIDLENNADYSNIMDELAALASSSFINIDSPYIYIDSILDSRAGQSIYGAYTLNVLFSIMYLSAGITLVVTSKLRKMRKHFSLLRALGTEQESITRPVMIDTTASVALGAITGSIVGIILTMMVLRIPISYTGLSSTSAWEILPLTLSFPFELLALIIFIAFSFSIIATYFVMKRELSIDIAEDLSGSE